MKRATLHLVYIAIIISLLVQDTVTKRQFVAHYEYLLWRLNSIEATCSLFQIKKI